MADPKALAEWFDRIDRDLAFLCDCFAEVLDELGENDLAAALPWCSRDTDCAEISPERVDRELQALAISYHILNLVEEIAAARARHERRTRFGLFHEPGLWGHALKQRQNRGDTPEEIARALQGMDVEIVLTAHPTEAKRPLVLRQHRELFNAVWELTESQPADYDQATSRDRIKVILERLWRTGEMYLVKPDVLSELQYVLDYLGEVFPEAVVQVHRRLREAWTAARFPEALLDQVVPSPRLHFGDWVGGDRDGHPLVTPEVTRETLLRFRETALEVLQRLLVELSRNVSYTDYFQEPPRQLLDALEARRALVSANEWTAVRELPHEPWREWALHMRAGVDRALNDEPGGYASPEELVADLHTLRDSLLGIGASRLARAEIDPLLIHLDTFGFHLAALDIRQNSAYYATAMTQLLEAAGIPDSDYANWSHEKRERFLREELKSLRPLAPRDAQLGTHAREVIDCLGVVAGTIREHGGAAIGSFIVSMTQHVSDLLVVYAFAREAGLLVQVDGGLRSLIRVVPLFETLSDLQHANTILRAFLEHPLTQNTNRVHSNTPAQQIMVGYSDSNKDAGIFASQWALQRAQRELTQTTRSFGLRPVFFHGRGGTFSRGAGPTHRFLESLPPGSLAGHIRLTEQGEVIAQKFGNLPTAVFNLELLIAGVTASSERAELLSLEYEIFCNICERLSKDSESAYRSLLSGDGFIEFWSQATPVDALENSFIGSRPARRSGKRSLEDLRAIPWVFGWAQSRYYLPGWYGIGSALDTLQKETPDLFDTLRLNISTWPFAQYVLYNAETSLASADPDLMRAYAELVEDAEVRERQFRIVLDEYERSENMIDAVFGTPRAQRRPRLIKTLDMRARGLRRMHERQIQLLRQWRKHRADGDDEAADSIFPTLLLSINAIAGAERTTG